MKFKPEALYTKLLPIYGETMWTNYPGYNDRQKADSPDMLQHEKLKFSFNIVSFVGSGLISGMKQDYSIPNKKQIMQRFAGSEGGGHPFMVGLGQWQALIITGVMLISISTIDIENCVYSAYRLDNKSCEALICSIGESEFRSPDNVIMVEYNKRALGTLVTH